MASWNPCFHIRLRRRTTDGISICAGEVTKCEGMLPGSRQAVRGRQVVFKSIGSEIGSEIIARRGGSRIVGCAMDVVRDAGGDLGRSGCGGER
jgi:hypothetical protein